MKSWWEKISMPEDIKRAYGLLDRVYALLFEEQTCQRTEVKLATGLCNDAIQTFRKCIDNPEGCYGLATSLLFGGYAVKRKPFSRKRIENAANLYSKAIELDPTFYDAYFMRGLCRKHYAVIQLGESASKEEIFETLSSAETDFADAYLVCFWHFDGSFEDVGKQLQEIGETKRRLERTQPDTTLIISDISPEIQLASLLQELLSLGYRNINLRVESESTFDDIR